jgi:hypothetical protein
MLVRLADGLWQMVVWWNRGISPGLWLRIAPSEVLARYAEWLLFAGFLWLAAWWWFALDRGFRLQRATLVWGVFMVVSVLAAANGLMIIFVIRGLPW